jgi:hypothetical protein
LFPWDLIVVRATKISHEEDIFFNQFSKPFLDTYEKAPVKKKLF